MQITGTATLTAASQTAVSAAGDNWAEAKASRDTGRSVQLMLAGVVGAALYDVSAVSYSSGTNKYTLTLVQPWGGTTGDYAVYLITAFTPGGLPLPQDGDAPATMRPQLRRAFTKIDRVLQSLSTQRITQVAPTGGVASFTFDLSALVFDDIAGSVIARSTDAAALVGCRFQANGDTGSNYQWSTRYASNGGAAAVAFTSPATAIEVGVIAGAGSDAGLCGSAQFFLAGYRRAFKKNVASIAAAMTGTTNALANREYAGTWLNTAAITSLTFFPSAGNFAAGSAITLELRGVAADVALARDQTELFAPWSLPMGVLTQHVFDFAVTKMVARPPRVWITTSDPIADQSDIRFVVQWTTAGINVQLVNPPPTANYLLWAEG